MARLSLIGVIVTAVFTFAGVVIVALIQRSPTPTAQPLLAVESTHVLQPAATPMPPTLQPRSVPGIVATRTSEKDGMVQVYIPAGEFQMGSADSDPGAGNDEFPQHTVYLDTFWIDRTPVTNEMYALCVKAGACQPPVNTNSHIRNSYYGNPQYDNYPVIYVSWNDAKSYCEWAGRHLLTEAQWEKAARGTDGRTYPWGNAAPDSKLLNFNGQVDDTTEVGNYSAGASPYGALDMAGNVWAWVADWYDQDYYAEAPFRNPQGPSSGSMRVVRGSGWGWHRPDVRAASRTFLTPDARHEDGGIRCVALPGD